MIEPLIQKQILDSFDAQRGLYQDLASSSMKLIEKMLRDKGIQVHSVTGRCKESGSLAKKIAKPDKTYSCLEEVTDLAGVRVTTYFADDVDRVAEIIEEEFEIDFDRSVDKRIKSDPDRFGYQSVHHIVSFSETRAGLVEYHSFGGKKFEIQIRSILQHAWAEIEHDLGYKSSLGVPREIRRRFARVASLLELADDEFQEIRNSLARYEWELPKLLSERPEQVSIDLPSLKSAYTHLPALSELDSAIASIFKTEIDLGNHVAVEQAPDRLGFCGVQTIGDLISKIQEKKSLVEQFAVKWGGKRKYADLPVGIGTMYLAYVLVGEHRDEGLAHKYFEQLSLGRSKDREDSSKRLVSIMRELTGQSDPG